MKNRNPLKINTINRLLFLSVITFGVLLITSLNINAQENLKFEKVIQTDSISKSQLFVTINDWFATVLPLVIK